MEFAMTLANNFIGEIARPYRTLRDSEGNEVARQAMPASLRYRVADPGLISERLQEAGWRVERHGALTQHRGNRTPLVQALSCIAPCSMRPLADHTDYVPALRILLAHNARHAVKFALGVMRLACSNQFRAPAYRIVHTSPEMDTFLTNPASFCAGVLSRTTGSNGHGTLAIMTKKLESLRSMGTRGPAERLLNAIALARPKLMGPVLASVSQYAEPDGELSYWSVLQGLTSTHNARLEGYASILLGPDHGGLERNWSATPNLEAALRN